MTGKKVFVIFLCLLCMLSTLSCSQKDVDIVGTWQSAITEEITYVFEEDGNLYGYWEQTPTDHSTYEAEGNRITIDQDGEFFVLYIEGSELLYEGEVVYRKI